MKAGTLIVMPVSRVASLLIELLVSPLTAFSV
jgi:hypothetical protein